MERTRSRGDDDEPAVDPPKSALLLIVDDDDASREVLELVLVDEGFEVLAAGRPADALAQVAQRGVEVDMLLTDVHLPGMSGPELADRVRRLCPRVRVAFVSGDVEPPPRSRGLFVPKPVDLDALVALVRRELGRG